MLKLWNRPGNFEKKQKKTFQKEKKERKKQQKNICYFFVKKRFIDLTEKKKFISAEFKKADRLEKNYIYSTKL